MIGVLILFVLIYANIFALDCMNEKILENFSSNSVKTLVVPISALGLGNRLRIISSMFVLSRNINRKLIILWQSSTECNTPFSQIFQISSFLLDYLLIIDCDNNPRELLRFISTSLSLSIKEIHGNRLENNFFLNATSMTCTDDILLFWTRGSHTTMDHGCADYIHLKSIFYSNILPSNDVMNILSSSNFMALFSQYNVIGVHIRAYDRDFDWAVVTPHSYLSNEINRNDNRSYVITEMESKRFDEMSPLDAFIVAIRSILSSNNTTKFYVASNSYMAKHLLSKAVGSSHLIELTAPADKNGRSTHEGMLFTAAEFFLLGQTSLILHSRGSSFAREAAFFHNRPVIDVFVRPQLLESDGSTPEHSEPRASYTFLLTQYLNLPYCGIQEYYRDMRILPNRLKRCYNEAHDRIMCTALITVCACDDEYSFLTHGLTNLYCNIYDEYKSRYRNKDCFDVLAESNGYSI